MQGTFSEHVSSMEVTCWSRLKQDILLMINEFLAVVYFTQYYRHYLIGRRFFLYTDHQALTYVLTVKDPPSRLFRWLMKLQDYDFDIIYRPGKTNANADALSRLAYSSVEPVPNHYNISVISTVSRLSTTTPGYGLSDKD